jgi:hypothetical protein
VQATAATLHTHSSDFSFCVEKLCGNVIPSAV